MKKGFFLMVTAALLLFFATACSEKSSAPEQKHDEKKTDEAKKASADKKENASESKKKQEEKPEKKQEKPFKPMMPSKDAKPLKENYSQEAISKMPRLEAHGHSRERSVPFGQTLLKGTEDKSNGPLKKYRLVAFYGQPNSTQMGILGEKTPEALMKQLKEQAQAYSDADPAHPAIPTIELITTIAQRNPGPDGLYFHRTSEQDIREYAELAKKNGALLLLDVQLGRDNVLHQVKLLEPYLKLPYVHLAIDTEFHVKEGQVPGVDLGHVDGREIDKAIQYVSDLAKKNHLPDKIVVVHQFKGEILANKKAIKPRDNVEVALNYDGFGPPGSKMASYQGLVRNEPIQYGGFKLFFKNDKPLLTPKEVLKLDPAPAIIDYQ
ncbi:hypothetical protein EV207_1321 [Scopulibacillus darangshiensis]|uniref:Lipoprotein n=1 Tax=Scopulibacillus darangshiensis TaxID=442528 RepID=A0A4R2NP39_9BACL|nr:hypothetical protein [Scopulibacillus darangshiensis]TCP23402.1 hypothetical protein EV207_1321 [Scopulibacillus darangshiensis]